MKVTNWQAENITISWPIFIIAHSHLKLLKTLVAMNLFLLCFFTPCKKLLKASYIVAMVTYQVEKMTITCLPMIRHLLVVLSTDKE